MNVTLRQLRAFTGVYRARSITRAARELGITQSATSLLIQQLEAQLGVKLFDRTTRAVQPTLAAHEAFHAAERMLGDAQGLSRRMRDLAEARAGRVAFLASAGAASALMPRVLAQFRAVHPDIEIDMRDVAADDLVPRMIATDAEFAIGSVEGEIAEMKIETLIGGRLSAIGRATAEFAARRSLTWDELAHQPVIAMRRETRIRMQIDQTLGQQGKRLAPTYEVTLINTALAMTAQGLGLAILPATMLPADQFPMLIAKPLTRPAITRPVSLLQRAGPHAVACRKSLRRGRTDGPRAVAGVHRSGVVLSSGAIEAPGPRISQTRSLSSETMALRALLSKNKTDNSVCGQTARQTEDVMAWRDDKARATLIREAAEACRRARRPALCRASVRPHQHRGPCQLRCRFPRLPGGTGLGTCAATHGGPCRYPRVQSDDAGRA